MEWQLLDTVPISTLDDDDPTEVLFWYPKIRRRLIGWASRGRNGQIKAHGTGTLGFEPTHWAAIPAPPA